MQLHSSKNAVPAQGDDEEHLLAQLAGRPGHELMDMHGAHACVLTLL
jgi:hypothetical protein